MAIAQSKKETRKVVALLGGARVFRGRVKDAGDLQEALRRGLPYGAFDALLEALEFSSRDHLASLLGVAARTLARRKASRHLSPTESDRLYRVAHVTFRAAEALGSLGKARGWLHGANRALGGDSPVSLLDTEIGARQVEELLSRISHGILS